LEVESTEDNSVSEENVYDPLDYQMREVNKILGDTEVTVESLSKRPEAIQLLLGRYNALLIEQKGIKSDYKEINTKRENLRVDNARLREKSTLTIIEIPISLLGGFALNRLATNISDSLGWFGLIITVMLLNLY
jgi:hypothetical protein